MFTRRTVLKLVGGALMAGATENLALANVGSVVREQQKGDPDDAYEYVSYQPDAISTLVTKQPGKATFEPWKKNLPEAMLLIARTFISCSRSSTPDQIAQFLKLFDLPLRDKDGYVAFCAAGLSFAALRAYKNALAMPDGDDEVKLLRSLAPDVEHYYFYPTVSCVDMWNIAKGKRRWVQHNPGNTDKPHKGWVVLFDWNRRGIPDHCGIVQGATQEGLSTIEFNTTITVNGNQRNGGVVAGRLRPYDYVLGFIVTDAPPR